jgi:hypothetical protein
MKVLYQFERFWEIQTEVQPSLNWENQKNVHCIEIVKFFGMVSSWISTSQI